MTKLSAVLIKKEVLDENIHYGAYSRYWWRFYCESSSCSSINPDPTTAISTVYKEIFNTQTRYSGFLALRWTDKSIIKQLLSDVSFVSIFSLLSEYKIFVSGIGSSSNAEWNHGGPGYKSSLLRSVNRKSVLYFSTIEDNSCTVEVHKDFEIKNRIEGSSPNEVWQKLNIQKHTGIQLFGLDDLDVQSLIHQHHVPTCLPKNCLFLKWQESQTNIGELYSSLGYIYPLDYQFSDREISAWHEMLCASSCQNITPWAPEESKYQLWIKNALYENNQDILQQLYNLGFLNSSPSYVSNKTRIFWQCFNQALADNKKTKNGKRRILSIIANDF
ncbi:14954_t:CDS:2, partial [Cetraspora pellucida]